MIMIYYSGKKLTKRLDFLEADMITKQTNNNKTHTQTKTKKQKNKNKKPEDLRSLAQKLKI